MGSYCSKDNNNYFKSIENMNTINYYRENSDDYECCICFDDNIENSMLIKCHHFICKKCCIYLLFENKNCQICNQNFEFIYNFNINNCIKKPECLELKLNPNYNELQYELSYFDFTDKNINDEYINNIINKLEIGNTCIFKLNKNKKILTAIYFPKYNNMFYQNFKLNHNNDQLIITTIYYLYHIKNYIFWYNCSETKIFIERLI